jgi:hypothetical protein
MKGKENSNRKKTSQKMESVVEGCWSGDILKGRNDKTHDFCGPPKGLKRMRHHAYTYMLPTMCSDAIFYRFFQLLVEQT